MPSGDFPPDVRAFLKQHVASIEQLEILLLLRASPDTQWSVREVYQRILTNESSILHSLEKLAGAGLITSPSADRYQFVEGPPGVRATLDTLATLYKEQPTRMIRELYGPTPSEIQAFAQAFKLRKRPE